MIPAARVDVVRETDGESDVSSIGLTTPRQHVAKHNEPQCDPRCPSPAPHLRLSDCCQLEHVSVPDPIIILISVGHENASETDTDTYLEGVLGRLSVRRMMITVTVRPWPVRLAFLRSGTMHRIGARWERRTTPALIVTAFDAFVQVQASHGRGNPGRLCHLLIHTTAGLG